MFKPGQSGNPAGRPKGSRSKLQEDFLETVYADWKEHGAGVVADVRLKDPATYLRVVAQILPKEAKLDVEHSGVVNHEHVAVPETARWIEDALGGREAGASPQSLPN